MARLGMRPKVRDRFSKWAPGAAMLVLAGFIALLIIAALTERTSDLPDPATAAASTSLGEQSAPGEDPERDTDLRLYDKIAERVGAGENYYAVAVEEQRARDFPVRPGLAVRLPTLAFVSGHLGDWAMLGLAVLLGLATLAAWWHRLDDDAGARDYRTYGLLLLVIGTVAGFKPQYLALHEVWAGMFIALSFGLHGDKKWKAAWCAAALALMVRELALPYVMLMGALAFMRGHRGEGFAWAFLVLLFGAGMFAHLAQVAALTSQADPLSPSWLGLRGLGGWTANIVTSGPLQMLPGFIAAPLALLPLIGWAGWRSDTGLTGFLLCTGYGVFFMIAGRDNNFYWALVVMPVWFIGLAFTPRALASLWNSARGA